jgi:trans-2,3-dihydro-3-hydroxyanthranilate isomerase
MAKWIKAKRMSAFTSLPYGGNPAWVILNAEGLSDDQMRRLANDLNPLSDTAFVLSESTHEADIFLRFFTGSGEVNFSGHAAVATYFALSGENILSLKEPYTIIRQRTKAGVQQVELRVKGDKITRVTILLAKPNYLEVELNTTALARCLGITPKELSFDELPFDVISAGYYDLIIPMKSLDAVRNINPNFSLMDSICTRLGIHGMILFSTETFEPGNTAFMRHFAPSLGVNEDPISGASAGSLGCYLIRHKMIEPTNFSRIIIEQGYLQDRQGKVYVHIECTRDQILRVKVGGSSVLTFTGYILTPDVSR